MKLIRNLAATLILACALGVNVYAGDQQTPAKCETCPPPPPATCEECSDTSSNEQLFDAEAEDTVGIYDALWALLSVY